MVPWLHSLLRIVNDTADDGNSYVDIIRRKEASNFVRIIL